MTFETFRGTTVEEALVAVKAAFGTNALIGSTRQVTNGRSGNLGHSYFEVMAAPGPSLRMLDRPQPFSKDAVRVEAIPPAMLGRKILAQRDSLASTRRRESKEPSEAVATRVQASADVLQAVMAVSADAQDKGAATALKPELDAIRALLEELNTGKLPRDRAMAVLRDARIEGALAKKLALGAPKGARVSPEAIRAHVRERIAEMLTLMPSPIEQPGPRMILCVGPTGVGKTTTIAKLAARAYLDLQRSVSIVTLDTFRVGSVDQMRRFAELIGVPFDVAYNGAGFAQSVARRQAEVVLVDTASLPPTHAKSASRLIECLQAVTSMAVDVLLVLPAAIHPRDAERIAAAYTNPAPTGLVITKMDETDQVGGVLHAALPGQIPVAYLCSGPRVPEDIQNASVEALIETVVPS